MAALVGEYPPTTDHGTGTGGCAFLTGRAARGCRVAADRPGLARTAPLDDRDLWRTLDRDSRHPNIPGQ